MNVRSLILLIALSTVLARSCLAQEPLKQQPETAPTQARAEAFLERARHLSDIRAKDAPAFRLKATFSFIGDNLDPIEGTYTETWVSDSQWRRETVIGNLHHIEVGGADKVRLVFPEGFPVQANSLPALMAFLPPASMQLTFAFIRERTTSEVTAECAFSRPVIQSLQIVFCFEKKTGVLLETAFPEKRPRNTVVLSCEYGSFRKFGDYEFPREAVCYEDSHKKISARVVELSLEPSMDPALFDPPAGAIELGRCSGKKVPPSLSISEIMIPKLDPESVAWLRIWLVVDAKGKPQDVRFLRSAANDSNSKTLTAVRGWRFMPGTCDGKPMPMALTLDIPSTPR